MLPFQFENYVQVKLDATLAAGATTLTFNAPEKPFHSTPPNGDARFVLIDSLSEPTAFEVIQSTGATATSLTGLTRGVEGTTDREWPEGTFVIQVLTADIIEQMITEINAAGSATPASWQIIGGNYTASAGDRLMLDVAPAGTTISLPASPSEFDAVEIIDYALNGNTLTIGGAGDTIMGNPGPDTVNWSGFRIRLEYTNPTNGWVYTRT